MEGNNDNASAFIRLNAKQVSYSKKKLFKPSRVIYAGKELNKIKARKGVENE